MRGDAVLYDSFSVNDFLVKVIVVTSIIYLSQL